MPPAQRNVLNPKPRDGRAFIGITCGPVPPHPNPTNTGTGDMVRPKKCPTRGPWTQGSISTFPVLGRFRFRLPWLAYHSDTRHSVYRLRSAMPIMPLRSLVLSKVPATRRLTFCKVKQTCSGLLELRAHTLVGWGGLDRHGPSCFDGCDGFKHH